MIIKKIMSEAISIVLKLTPVKKNQIVVLEYSYPSGSNTKILYENLKNLDGFEVMYIDMRNKGFSYRMRNYFIISRSYIILSTHGFRKYHNRQISINLWHGIPLKAMNRMEKNITKYLNFSDDYLVSNSRFESILLSSCMSIPYDKHLHLGSPRLDYFNEDNAKETIPEFQQYSNVIFYLPTFRSGYKGRVEGIFTGELFNLDKVDYEKINSFLKDQNILLVVKYHPNELEGLSTGLEGFTNILSITDNYLEERELDLYELLPQSDMLITDYSSVYFDYLLLNKPIIFIPTDLEKYIEDRGILLEPYERWTPGPKVTAQKELQEAIIDELENDNYLQERQELIKTFYTKENPKSNCEEIINLIQSL